MHRIMFEHFDSLASHLARSIPFLMLATKAPCGRSDCGWLVAVISNGSLDEAVTSSVRNGRSGSWPRPLPTCAKNSPQWRAMRILSGSLAETSATSASPLACCSSSAQQSRGEAHSKFAGPGRNLRLRRRPAETFAFRRPTKVLRCIA